MELHLKLFVVFLFGYATCQDCVVNPENPVCVNYTLPANRTANDLGRMCNMMANMPACTVKTLCEDMPSDPNCDQFALYKLSCGGAMGMMKPCNDFNSMCNVTRGSKVVQCNTTTLPIPDEYALFGLIQNLCLDMPMEGCSTCTDADDCDTLTLYSNFCQMMKGDPNCATWRNLCKFVGYNWTLCTGGSKVLPEMKMYFHYGIYDYLLFKPWVPQTNYAYYLALLGIVLFTIFYEGLKAARAILELKWRVRHQQRSHVNEEKRSLMRSDEDLANEYITPCDLAVDVPRAFLRALELVVSYFLMLIAMTFNVGYFCAVIGGAFIGILIFGRFQHPTALSGSNNTPVTSLTEGCH